MSSPWYFGTGLSLFYPRRFSSRLEHLGFSFDFSTFIFGFFSPLVWRDIRAFRY